MSKVVRQAVLEADVIQSGHYIFASGLHSDTKLDMPKLLEHPRQARIVRNSLIEVLRSKLIVPVPKGALAIANEWLADSYDVVPAYKLTPQVFVLHIGQSAILNSTNEITIFEDVVSTAGSAASLGRTILNVNPQAELHLVAIWRGNEVTAENAASFTSQTYLVEEPMPSWPAEECSCAQGSQTIAI